MSSSSPPTPGTWPWLRERLFPRGTNLIQWASFVILISMMILYVLEPPNVSQFQFISTLVVLAVLLVINILLDDLKAIFTSEQASIWAIMLLSSALAFYAIVVGQLFIGVYILFMIMAQANALLPLPPALGLSKRIGDPRLNALRLPQKCIETASSKLFHRLLNGHYRGS